jgi:diguanylate cyclase (GGDEF)-like protein
MLHPVLQRQLKKLGLDVNTAPDAKAWARFLERLDHSYRDNDQDRYLVERSLEVSSEEMRDLTRQLRSALDQVRNLSLTDELTGLRNRRFLNVSMPDEVALVIRKYRAQGNEQRLSTNFDILFFLVDLDLFKNVNDTYGHLAGDQVLVQTAKLLTGCSRGSDFVIRWGGEEFLVVKRRSSVADLKILAERIRQAVETHSFEIGRDQPIHLTCSVGAAAFPFVPKWPGLFGLDRMVGLVDLCLYAAKRSGRNAWVGILSTDRLSLDEVVSPLDTHFQQLVREAKLDLVSNLPPNKVFLR